MIPAESLKLRDDADTVIASTSVLAVAAGHDACAFAKVSVEPDSDQVPFWACASTDRSAFTQSTAKTNSVAVTSNASSHEELTVEIQLPTSRISSCVGPVPPEPPPPAYPGPALPPQPINNATSASGFIPRS